MPQIKSQINRVFVSFPFFCCCFPTDTTRSTARRKMRELVLIQKKKVLQETVLVSFALLFFVLLVFYLFRSLSHFPYREQVPHRKKNRPLLSTLARLVLCPWLLAGSPIKGGKHGKENIRRQKPAVRARKLIFLLPDIKSLCFPPESRHVQRRRNCNAENGATAVVPRFRVVN